MRNNFLKNALLVCLLFVVTNSYAEDGFKVLYDRAILVADTLELPSHLPFEKSRESWGAHSALVYFEHELNDSIIDKMIIDFGLKDAISPRTAYGNLFIPQNDIIVLLNDDYPIDSVIDVAGISKCITEIECAIEGIHMYFLTHSLSANKTDSLSLCLMATGLCKAAETSYAYQITFCSANLNSQYQNQWYIETSVDSVKEFSTNAYRAWNISKGDGVTVGVFDSGIQTDHEDLKNKITDNYIVKDFVGNDTLLDDDLSNPYYCNAHGTNCAGIIAAEDNEVGIVGVAPNSSLLNAKISKNSSIKDTVVFCTDKGLIDAIDYSVQKGCDVLNFSFVLHRPASQNLKESIANAQQKGRDGKGCVIIASAGNSDSIGNVNLFPYNVPGIIIVGASDERGERVKLHNNGSNWGSNYGHNSVMAPGTNIYTTNLIQNATNSYTFWDGTSASAPIVSGIAALMISANDTLTSSNINEIICRTAKKVRTDKYQYSTKKEYGLWNEEMGYGLIDGYSAVRSAKRGCDVDFLIRDNLKDSLGVEPYIQLNQKINSPDINLYSAQNGGNVVGITSLNTDREETNDTCLLAVNIKNLSCRPSSNNESERLFCVYGLATLKSRQSANIPLWIRSLDGWITDTNGVSICKLGWNEEKIAAGYIPFVYPKDNIDIFYQKISQRILNRSVLSLLNSYHHGFYIMAIADEGLHKNFLSKSEFLPISKDYVAQHNSASVSLESQVLSNQHFGYVTAVLPPINSSFQIRISQRSRNEHFYLNGFAETYVLLSDNLMNLLETTSDMKFIDSNRLVLSDTTTTLNFLRPLANEDYFLGTEVHFVSDRFPEINDFEYDIELISQGEIEDVQTITAVRNPDIYFVANATASKNKVIKYQESTTLSSNVIDDDATYTWFDEDDNIIGEGSEITITPTESHTYTINIMNDNNGYFAQDTVRVIVVDGEITSIFPNPSRGEDIHIHYTINDPEHSYIRVANMTNSIYVTLPTIGENDEAIISSSVLPTGIYYITLYSNGIVVDTQQLIVM